MLKRNIFTFMSFPTTNHSYRTSAYSHRCRLLTHSHNCFLHLQMQSQQWKENCNTDSDLLFWLRVEKNFSPDCWKNFIFMDFSRRCFKHMRCLVRKKGKTIVTTMMMKKIRAYAKFSFVWFLFPGQWMFFLENFPFSSYFPPFFFFHLLLTLPPPYDSSSSILVKLCLPFLARVNEIFVLFFFLFCTAAAIAAFISYWEFFSVF